jgi:hypothetical protein
LTNAGSVGIPLTAADYQPYVAQAAALKADAYAGEIAPFMTNLFLGAGESLAQPLTIGLSAAQFNNPTLVKYGSPGGSLEGSLLTAPLPPQSATNKFPQMKLPAASIASYYKATKDPDASPLVLTGIATQSWVDTYAFVKIAKTISGDVTAASVTTALNNAKNVNLLGAISWTPSAQGPTGYARVSNPYEYLITVKNGKEVLWKSKPINSMTPLK